MKTKTRIGLMGFGRAGKSVASVILQNPNFSLEWVYRRSATTGGGSIAETLGLKSDSSARLHSKEELSVEELMGKRPVDFIIDFSSEQGIYEYGEAACRNGVKIISAISHYASKEKAYLKKLSERTVLFWSANITIGINFLLIASKILKKIAPQADVVIIEEHFKQKKEVSGTALKIAEELDIHTGDINSIRAGGIVGKHQLVFGFPYQTVRLIHESISREAFGNGALFAAENLRGKPNGYYVFEDLVSALFQS